MRTVAVDFDGVLHSYVTGWQGPRTITDPPMPGAINFLREFVRRHVLSGSYNLVIFSSRARHWGGRAAMRRWLKDNGLEEQYIREIKFPVKKPPVHMLIDDRAWQFTGVFPTIQDISRFKPWNRKRPLEHKDKQNLHRLRTVTNLQCGIWDYSSYGRGFANGLILALSIMEDREPQYLPDPISEE